MAHNVKDEPPTDTNDGLLKPALSEVGSNLWFGVFLFSLYVGLD